MRRASSADTSGSALIGFEDKVRGLVAEQPDVTVTELWRKLTALGIKVGRSAVGRFLQRLQLTFKKTLRAAEQGRADVEAARTHWREMQPGLDSSTASLCRRDLGFDQHDAPLWPVRKSQEADRSRA